MAEGGSAFKARAIPDSMKEASIKPRLSKAAALRMGLPLPEAPKRRESSSTSKVSSTLGISGLPRSDITVPKSLQAPSIAPRLNRVAAARTNAEISSVSSVASKERKPIDFSNTPGHKRQPTSTSRPASLAAPTLAPRLNKIAAARLGETINEKVASARSTTSNSPDQARKPVDYSDTPGHKRMSIGPSSIKSLQAPTLAPRANRVSMSRLGGSLDLPPKSTITKSEPLRASVKAVGKENQIRREVDYSNTPGHKRVSTGAAIASLAQPSITPRINATARKRLSMSVGPVSDMDVKSQTARPSSRSSMSGAHQDGFQPRLSMRASQGPPSSFRMR